MTKKPIKAVKMECKADLTHRVVSLSFQDDAKETAEIWLAGPSIFALLGEIERMLDQNPEMQTWKANYRPN